MTVKTVSTPTMPAPQRHPGRGALLAALGGAIALAALAGAGLWARTDSRDAGAPANALQPPQADGARVSDFGGPYVPSVVYIVGSQEEAEKTLAGFAWLDAHNTSPVTVPAEKRTVIVIDSNTDATTIAGAFDGAAGLGVYLGPRPDSIVDLRGR